MWNFPIEAPKASSFAAEFDALFYLITLLTIFFTVLVYAMVLWFVVKYRRGSKADRTNPMDHNIRLELIWTIIPTLIALGVFAWGTKLFIHMRTPPKDAMEIFVIGKQWMWHVQHPSGIRENNELHVPAGKAIRLTMISQDVIHGFAIPAFRIQYHVVPGRYTNQWFVPTTPGRYNLFCTMHCGAQHSEMGGYVTVLSQADYANWVARGGNDYVQVAKTPAEEGKQLYEKLRCDSCHTERDTDKGPTLYGLLGKTRKFTDGSSDVADEDYIRESIIDPHTRLNAGYENTMPVYIYKEQISEEQIRNIIEFMKTMGMPPLAVPGASTTATANNP